MIYHCLHFIIAPLYLTTLEPSDAMKNMVYGIIQGVHQRILSGENTSSSI
jgi:hypothetical protein